MNESNMNTLIDMFYVFLLETLNGGAYILYKKLHALNVTS